MKKLILLSLIFLAGCATNTVNQTEKKDEANKKTEGTQTMPKEGWIYNTPWGKSAAR